MSSYLNLTELKSGFMSDPTMSTRQLFSHMEQIVVGTTSVQDYLDSLLVGGTGDEILAKARQKYIELQSQLGRPPTLLDRYPSLDGHIAEVSYREGDTPKEWDIASEMKGGGIGLYVYLDGQWTARCSIGDPLTTLSDDLPFGYRLVNV